MVYNTQDDWTSSLCPSPEIRNTWKHKAPETGSVSVFSEGRETPTLLSPLKRVDFIPEVGVSLPSSEDRNR
jgi:hypothetical protein